jgi:hypothetical protein
MPGVPSNHVSGLPVSDLPDTPGGCNRLRVVAGLPPDPHRRHSAQAPRGPRFLDGRFARPTGRGHAGCRRRNNNDKTWFDMAGDFHSDALHVVERYRMTDPDTIQYEATIEDSKVFTKPWTISLPLHRRTDWTGFSSTPVRLKPKRRAARSSAKNEPGTQAVEPPRRRQLTPAAQARDCRRKPRRTSATGIGFHSRWINSGQIRRLLFEHSDSRRQAGPAGLL